MKYKEKNRDNMDEYPYKPNESDYGSRSSRGARGRRKEQHSPSDTESRRYRDGGGRSKRDEGRNGYRNDQEDRRYKERRRERERVRSKSRGRHNQHFEEDRSIGHRSAGSSKARSSRSQSRHQRRSNEERYGDERTSKSKSSSRARSKSRHRSKEEVDEIQRRRGRDDNRSRARSKSRHRGHDDVYSDNDSRRVRDAASARSRSRHRNGNEQTSHSSRTESSHRSKSRYRDEEDSMSRHKREKSRPRSKEPRPSRGSKSDRGSKSSKYYVDEGDSRTDRSSRSSNSRYENGSIKSNRGSGREEGRRRNELKRITEVQNVKGNNWDTVPHERCRPTRDDRRENTSSGGIPKSALSTNVLSQIKSTGTVKKAVKTNKKPTAMNKFLSMGLFLSKKGSKQEKEGWESKESSSSMNSKNPKSLSTNNEGGTRTPPFRSYEGTERIGLQKADPRHGESIRTFNTFGGKKYRSNYPPPSPAGSVQTYTPGMTRENRSVDMGYGSRIHEKRPDSVDGKSWHQKDRIQDRFEESRKVGSREGNYGQTSQQRKVPSGSRYATREDAYSRKDDKGSGRYKTQRSWSPPTTDSSVAQRRQQFESSMKKKSEQYPTTTEKWNRDNTFNQKARRQENIFDGRGNEYPDESSETRRRREYREPISSNSTSTTQWRQDYKSSQQREGIYYDTMKRPDHAEVGSRHNYYRDKESWRQDRTNYGRNDTFPNHPNHHDNSDMGKGGSPMNNGSGSAHPLHRQDRHLENLNPPRISEKQGNHIPTTVPYHKINRSMEPSNDNVTHSFNPPPNYHNNDDVRNKVVGNVIKNPPLHQNSDMESRYSSRNNDFCATSPHSQYDNGYNNRATAPLHDSTREDSHYHMNRMAGRNEVHNAQRFDRHDSRVQQESQERKIGAPINTGSGHANANVNSNNLHYHQGGTTQTTNHQRNSGNNENFSSANYPGEREQFNDRQGYGDSHVTRPFPHAIQNPSGNAHQAQHNSYQNTSQHKEQYSYSMTSNTGREAFYPHSDNSHYGTVINAHEGFNGNETLPPSPGRGEMPVGSMKYGGGGDSGSYIENNHPAHHQINQWGGGGRPQREENENYAFSRISGNNEIASQYVDGRMDNSGSQPNMHINHKESATGPPSTYRNNEIESNIAHGIGMNPPGMVSKKPGKVSKSSMPGAGKPKSALSLSLLSDLKTDNKKFLNKSPGPPSPNQKQSNSNAIASGGNPLLAQIKMGAQLKPPRADDKRIKQLETPARPISIMDEIKLAKPLKKVDSRNLQKKPIDERDDQSNASFQNIIANRRRFIHQESAHSVHDNDW